MSKNSIRHHRARRAAAGATALLLGLGAAGLALAAPAGAAGTVTVTPSDNLADGDTATVDGAGLPAGQLVITQCGNAATDGTPIAGPEPAAADCNGAAQLGTGGIKLVTGPEFSTTYNVQADGIGASGATCISAADANFPCTIVIADLSGATQAAAPIYFGEDAPVEEPPGEVPAAPETETFCAAAEDTTYPDVNSNQDVISCLAASAITEGYADGTFRPGVAVRRDQMASFLIRLGDLANALEVEGAELQDLPEYGGVNRFTDVEADSVHVEAINRLADMGVTTGSTPVTFDPSAPVSRGQMTTFINRLEEFLTGEGFDAGEADYFNDDDTPPTRPTSTRSPPPASPRARTSASSRPGTPSSVARWPASWCATSPSTRQQATSPPSAPADPPPAQTEVK
ncbi:MAG TPA: S-layer homology domain-containing protein [Nocardioides sp.]